MKAYYDKYPKEYWSKQYRAGGWLRNPQTANERRQNATTEHADMVRPNRRPINLPNNWDDISGSNKKYYTKKQERRTRKNFRDSIRFM